MLADNGRKMEGGRGGGKGLDLYSAINTCPGSGACLYDGGPTNVTESTGGKATKLGCARNRSMSTER